MAQPQSRHVSDESGVPDLQTHAAKRSQTVQGSTFKQPVGNCPSLLGEPLSWTRFQGTWKARQVPAFGSAPAQGAAR